MYKQDKHPFPVTSCGRRRSNMMGSPLNSNEPRKTTKGKGRNFRTTEEGAGMTAKGVASYKAKNPGSKLKTAVTGDVKPGSKDAKRRKSFCADQKVGLVKEVKLLDAIDGNVRNKIKLGVPYPKVPVTEEGDH